MAKPLQQFQLGTDQTSVFQNEGSNGNYLTASVNGRRFQDGDEWKSTHSYTATQLATHIALCNRMLVWMMDNAPAKSSEEVTQ
jgi:hypothetical protein